MQKLILFLVFSFAFLFSHSIFSFYFLILFSHSIFAQNDTTKVENSDKSFLSKVKFSAYLEMCYFNESKKVCARIAFMAGTYSNANLAIEEGVLKNIFEAYIRVKISKKKNIWIYT